MAITWLDTLGGTEGYIKVITGSMYSGKTTMLFEDLRAAEKRGFSCVLFKHALDSRYCADPSQIITHTGETREATPIWTIDQALSLVKDKKVVALDEFHFFPGVGKFAHELANSGKIVITTGVHCSLDQKLIPVASDLLAVADKIELLRTLCDECGGRWAAFTKRKGRIPTTDSPRGWIGGSETYRVLCRRCLIEANAPQYPQLRCRRLTKEAVLPTLCSGEAVGFDLASVENVVVPAGGSAVISTGLEIEFPRNHYGRIASRSGLAANHQLHVGAGILDPDYRGPISVLLLNLGTLPFSVQNGMRIAQLLITPRCNPVVVETKIPAQPTKRGSNGFGSTGI